MSPDRERLALLVELDNERALSAAEDAELAGLLGDPAARGEAVAQRRVALLAVALTASTALDRAALAPRAALRLPSSRRLWLPVAAAAVVLAAFGIVRASRPAVVDGDGRAIALGSRWSGGAERELRFADGSAVMVAAGSSAGLLEAGPRARIRLDDGRLAARVAPQRPDGGFAVEIPVGEVAVVGTRFTVAAQADGAVVRVEEGRVRVRGLGGGEEQVGAGNIGVLDGDGPVAVPERPADRRPLIGIPLASGSFPRNPLGWFNDPDFDADDRAALHARLLDLADRVNAAARRLDAGGVIVWSLEGWREDLTFPGEPRRLPELAPDVDGVADAFFARLASGGLATGVVLKPGTVGRRGHRWTIVADGDDAATLADKVAYARRRWGCTRFFYGYNLTPAGQAAASAGQEPTADQILPWRPLARLLAEQADLRIHPEYATPLGWGLAPVWRRPDQLPIPSEVRMLWPEAAALVRLDAVAMPAPDAIARLLGEHGIPMIWLTPDLDPAMTEAAAAALAAAGR